MDATSLHGLGLSITRPEQPPPRIGSTDVIENPSRKTQRARAIADVRLSCRSVIRGTPGSWTTNPSAVSFLQKTTTIQARKR